LPNEDVSISHIWLNEIENSQEKSLEKIERGAILIKNLKIPAMAHRIYWEKTEDHEGIFIQLPYKIIYYQKDEATGVFEKIFQDNAESLQCVRP